MSRKGTSHSTGTSPIMLLIASLCLAVAPMREAAAQQADAAKPLPQSCPAKSGSGVGIVEVAILFSVSNPKQDVSCTYADGTGVHFQVDKGCDVEPTGTIADGMSAAGTGLSFGRHECRESEPGAGKCRIVCPQK